MTRAAIAALTAGLLATGAGGLPSSSAELPAPHLQVLAGKNANQEWRWNECRFRGIGTGAWSVLDLELTIRCISRKYAPPGGATKALSVWRCESGWALEPTHSDSYHGPMQYLASTYRSQRAHVRWIVRRLGVHAPVHNPRANVMVAVVWAAVANSWNPWTCA